MTLTRRQALAGFGVATAAAFLGARSGAAAEAAEAAPSGVAPGKRELLPLPFDPAKLRGLSERLLVSHHDNNYAGALANLNKVEEQLAAVSSTTPGFLVAGLRDRELAFSNSVILHELYFGNLGGSGKPSDAIQRDLSAAFGSFARFEELFRATGMSLAGGSGWALLDLCLRTGELRIHGSQNHTQAAASSAPLLVLDMYEHAYHMDFGAAAARYVDAFFANLQWDEVARRLERARRAWKALAG